MHNRPILATNSCLQGVPMTEQPRYRAFAKLYLAPNDGEDGKALGGGLVSLLRGVEESGSLNRAAKDMHMAYSKAWKLMNTTEEHLGVTLIERDGARGSALTDEGKLLLRCYDAVSREVEIYANELLRRELEKG